MYLTGEYQIFCCYVRVITSSQSLCCLKLTLRYLICTINPGVIQQVTTWRQSFAGVYHRAASWTIFVSVRLHLPPPSPQPCSPLHVCKYKLKVHLFRGEGARVNWYARARLKRPQYPPPPRNKTSVSAPKHWPPPPLPRCVCGGGGRSENLPG